MEDVMLRMPTADIAMLTQFAARMGWTINRRQDTIARFIAECSKNNPDAITDEEIQAEVNAVRYGR